jgi:hypothetical protein
MVRAVSVGGSLLIALGTILVFGAIRRTWWRPSFTVALFVSMPGIFALLALRADAPGKSAETAAHIARLEGAMFAHARTHGGCAVVTKNDCEACQPIARLALAHAGPCTSNATVELGEGALGGECVAIGPTLRCGGPRVP